MARPYQKITTIQCSEADHGYIKEMAREHGLNLPACLAAIVRGFRNASPTVQAQAFDLSRANDQAAPAESEGAA